MKQLKKGISLISLIITIIVIIILAAIVIFTGLNTPDRANFARFVQNFSDYNTAIMGDFHTRKTKNSVEGLTRTDAQVYYAIAKNHDITDINATPSGDGTVTGLGITTYPEPLIGNDFYEITSDNNIAGIKQQKQFYEKTEKHYVTDKGEGFFLPGYRLENDGEIRWYINERKYYIEGNPINFDSVNENEETKVFELLNGEYIHEAFALEGFYSSGGAAGFVNSSYTNNENLYTLQASWNSGYAGCYIKPAINFNNIDKIEIDFYSSANHGRNH